MDIQNLEVMDPVKWGDKKLKQKKTPPLLSHKP